MGASRQRRLVSHALALLLLVVALTAVADSLLISRKAARRRITANEAERLKASRRPYLLSSRAHGIHQFDIPAMMHVAQPVESNETKTRTTEAVILHIWLKGIRGKDSTAWRGLAFAESAEHIWLRDNLQLSQSPLFESWEPRISLRSIEDMTEYPFTVMKGLITFDWASDPRTRFMRPLPLNITLPNSLLDSTDFELRVADTSTPAAIEAESGGDEYWEKHIKPKEPTNHEWVKYGLFSPGLVHEAVHEVSKPAGAMSAYLVLPPAYGPRPQVALELLLHNAAYHLALGFTKIVRYAAPADLRHFLHDPRIHELVAQDKLELILWDSMAECSWHPLCSHPQILSHSLLAHWGQHVWLALADVDEFLALPAKWGVPQFMRACFPPTAVQVRIIRRNILCGDCQHLRKDGQRGAAELPLWTGKHAQHDPSRHPLSHYTLRDFKPEPHGVIKSFAHPDAVLSYGMHEGVVPGHIMYDPLYNVNEGEMPAECESEGPWWAHAMSLYKPRDWVGAPGSDWKTETAWLDNLSRIPKPKPARAFSVEASRHT
ncbi:hypothetical protein WJX72_003016 [[Myrmecia] bisecta]|uniref:Glycosyltransferase family 92 protein n=1 Tax=[Myrmecia] bisecta TaxID=41462 RepID=A0AAW1P1S3_9CHLO